MKFEVTGENIRIVEMDELVSDTVEGYRAEFVFDDTWQGYVPKAVFKHWKDHNTYEQPLDENYSCSVPWEVLKPGYIVVGVYGTADARIRPTLYCDRQYVKRGARLNRQDFKGVNVESITNKVTEITEDSTDEQYPSAKAVLSKVLELSRSIVLISTSGKRFKLTVDDSGALSTTEVAE